MNYYLNIKELKAILKGKQYRGFEILDVAYIKGKPAVYFYNEDGEFCWDFFSNDDWED